MNTRTRKHSNTPADWLFGAWAVFEKDLRLELRSRYAVNMLVMFVLSTLLLVLFAIGQESVTERVQSALLWVIVTFSAAIGLGRAFIGEEERGTVLLLQLNTQGSMVYAGKLVFNFLLVLGLNVIALGGFLLLFRLKIQAPGLLLATLLLGALGLSSTTTFLSAIIARTSNQGPLLPVLVFPVLIPLLLSVVSATRTAILGAGWSFAADELLTLVGFAGVTITAAFLLFEYVWRD
ncbi:MAG TPA: heme exporter protein CcmB [Rhodothermales bacterium]|nr:heme exporter protein CcmB [Rhodothermales bacterium]